VGFGGSHQAGGGALTTFPGVGVKGPGQRDFPRTLIDKLFRPARPPGAFTGGASKQSRRGPGEHSQTGGGGGGNGSDPTMPSAGGPPGPPGPAGGGPGQGSRIFFQAGQGGRARSFGKQYFRAYGPPGGSNRRGAGPVGVRGRISNGAEKPAALKFNYRGPAGAAGPGGGPAGGRGFRGDGRRATISIGCGVSSPVGGTRGLFHGRRLGIVFHPQPGPGGAPGCGRHRLFDSR